MIIIKNIVKFNFNHILNIQRHFNLQGNIQCEFWDESIIPTTRKCFQFRIITWQQQLHILQYSNSLQVLPICNNLDWHVHPIWKNGTISSSIGGKYLLENNQSILVYFIFMKMVLVGIHQCIFPNIYNMQ